MNNLLQIVQWDSDFFGYPIGRVNAMAIDKETVAKKIKEAKEKGMRLVYVFVKPDDSLSNSSLVDAGAKLVDQKVIFYTDIKDGFDTDGHINDYTETEPSAKLIDLAMQSGLYSRYRTDENFKQNEFEKLYHKWIENSVNKQLADYTLVYGEEGEELGFVTLKIKDNIGEIGLIAVDEAARGKSIGKKLVHAVRNILAEKNIPALEVATQRDNADACNFYSKVGFAINKAENIYHIWL